MKVVHVLGTGCAKCNTLEQNARKAIGLAGVEAVVEKVSDINKIIDFGVMLTPALVIDGQVKVAGKVPSAEDIARWLK